jgi:hypothetical protein
MAVLYKIVMTGQVLLTAIMTLIAGTPHLSCLCPDGATKPVCSPLAADPSGCCCGGGNCCSPDPQSGAGCCTASKPKEKSCCAANRQQKPSEQKESQFRAEHKCCVMTVGLPRVTAVSYYKTAVEKDVSLTPLHSESVTFARLPAAFTPAVWQINLTAPPTDLLDVLQHYLI